MRKLLMLLMVAAFAMACDDPKKDAKEGDEPKTETTAKAGGDETKPEGNEGAETAEADEDEDDEEDLSDEEVAEVAEAAAAEVTADNAEAEADALEKELEAELGEL